MAADRVLDQVQSLAAIEAFDCASYAAALAAEQTPAMTLVQLEVRDASLAAALARIDELAIRVMRIRLDHALAEDASIAAPTRRVFAQTVTSYADRLGLLAERARDVAARGRAPDPERVADAVAEAARLTLEQREAIRAPVLELVRALAAGSVGDAGARACDRDLDVPQRKRWSAARRDLELVAADPARIVAAAMPARLAALPEQLDEPAAAPEPALADLLELD